MTTWNLSLSSISAVLDVKMPGFENYEKEKLLEHKHFDNDPLGAARYIYQNRREGDLTGALLNLYKEGLSNQNMAKRKKLITRIYRIGQTLRYVFFSLFFYVTLLPDDAFFNYTQSFIKEPSTSPSRTQFMGRAINSNIYMLLCAAHLKCYNVFYSDDPSVVERETIHAKDLSNMTAKQIVKQQRKSKAKDEATTSKM